MNFERKTLLSFRSKGIGAFRHRVAIGEERKGFYFASRCNEKVFALFEVHDAFRMDAKSAISLLRR